MDPGADSVKLLDEQTFEVLDTFGLKDTEMGCSISSVQFSDDPKAYIAVGTAFVVPEEAEAKLVSSPFPRHSGSLFVDS